MFHDWTDTGYVTDTDMLHVYIERLINCSVRNDRNDTR